MTTARDRLLLHIRGAIASIRTVLEGRTIDDVAHDLALKPAFERYLEIISEASRHVPEQMKERHGAAIPWQKIAGLGSVLRHAYQHSNLRILWAVYTDDLDALEGAIEAMLAATPPAPSRS